ncbi:glycosyl hydrolase family 18 protein [Candidatus Zixiibacteriota bacterium]
MHKLIFVTLTILIMLTWASSPAPAAPGEHKSIHQLEWEAHRDDPPAPVPHVWPVRPLAKDKAPRLGREVLGYYPYWVSGYEYMRWDLLTTFAFFSLDSDGNGDFTNLHGWPATGIVDLAHANGVRVVVTLVCFSSGDITSILNSPANRQNLIDNLLTQVTAGNADGVNVDFEGVSSSQRDNLTTFMGALTRAFHDSIPGSHITMATPAVDWSSAFDYDALADSCDGLMIMGYGYRWSGSSTTGPVSPLTNWGSKNITWTVNDYLTKTGNDRDKIILGLPNYGRDWACDGPDPEANTTASGNSRIYDVAEPNARTYGKLRDEVALTPWYRYFTTEWHQCWYDDEVSLGLKENYINTENLAGMGIWALRYDEGHIALWNELEEHFGTVPNRLRVENEGDGSLRVSWGAALEATGYRVYRSSNGINFVDYIDVSDTTAVISDLNLGTVYYFKVSSLTAKGESPAGEVLAARTSGSLVPVLVINGYDRPKAENTRDFVIQHAMALDNAGVAFNSCANETIERGQVLLTDYDMVDWILGEESTQDESFNYTEQDSLETFLSAGGYLFVSGAETGWDLDYQGYAIDQACYNDFLKADYVKDDAGVYAVSGVGGTIFAGLSGITFDNGAHGTYDVRYPDCLNVYGGSAIDLTYDGTSYKAGIEYDGSFKLVNLGFPFETVYPEASRDSLMSRVLDFFGIAADIDQTPPSAVEDLSATLSNSDIFLAWSPVDTDTSGGPEEISHYIVYRDTSASGSPGDSIAVVSDTSYLDIGSASEDLPLYYIVKAVDTSGYKSIVSDMVGGFNRDLLMSK